MSERRIERYTTMRIGLGRRMTLSHKHVRLFSLGSVIVHTKFRKQECEFKPTGKRLDGVPCVVYIILWSYDTKYVRQAGETMFETAGFPIWSFIFGTVVIPPCSHSKTLSIDPLQKGGQH